jgi:hypothetical protein
VYKHNFCLRIRYSASTVSALDFTSDFQRINLEGKVYFYVMVMNELHSLKSFYPEFLIDVKLCVWTLKTVLYDDELTFI